MAIISMLNDKGQLVSDVNAVDLPPIIVTGNSKLVQSLNADFVDGIHANQFLRADTNTEVSASTTLKVNGKLEINATPSKAGELNLRPGGILRLGWFEIKAAGNLLYFEYSPQEYVTG